MKFNYLFIFPSSFFIKFLSKFSESKDIPRKFGYIFKHYLRYCDYFFKYYQDIYQKILLIE